jgi:gas vesicle protein
MARNNTFTAIGYMVVGLGIGAVAGLLAAPKSGKQIRKDLGRRLDDAREIAESRLEEARDAMGNLSKKTGEIWERGEELAETARRKAEPMARFLRRGA